MGHTEPGFSGSPGGKVRPIARLHLCEPSRRRTCGRHAQPHRDSDPRCERRVPKLVVAALVHHGRGNDAEGVADTPTIARPWG